MKLNYLIGIILLIVVFVFIGYIKQSEDNVHDTKITSPIKGKLEIIGKPLLNQNFELIYKLSSSINASNVVTKIRLPENIELISGNLEWIGNLEKDQDIELPPIELKVIKIGEYSIISNFDNIYLDVSEEDASVSEKPPRNNWWSTRGFALPYYENETNVDFEFGFAELPELNKEVGLITKIIPKENINNARVIIILHEKGLKLVSVDYVTKPTRQSEFTDKSGVDLGHNQISWVGDLKEGEEFKIKITVKTIVTGNGEIYSSVSMSKREGDITYAGYQGITESIKISVNKYGASLDKDLI